MPNLSLDLRFLRYALAAVEHGSFRRAASALAIPESTISRRVKLLEHRLGFPLFIRDARGVRLTDAGRIFLNDADGFARNLDRAARLAAATHRREQGDLRLGLLPSLTMGLFHLVLKRFKEKNSDIRLSLEEGIQEEILQRLMKGELDIALVTGQPRIAGHKTRLLWRESIYAVLPETHYLAGSKTLRWDEIASETFLISRSGSGPQVREYVVNALCAQGFTPQIDVHDLNREGLESLVAVGYGVSFSCTSTVRPDGRGVVFRPIESEVGSLPMSAVFPATAPHPAARTFLGLAAFIAKEAPSDARMGLI